MDFMGYKNVTDAVAIYGADGMADGFNIFYNEIRKVKVCGKMVDKVVGKRATVWVREYNPNLAAAPKKVVKKVVKKVKLSDEEATKKLRAEAAKIVKKYK